MKYFLIAGELSGDIHGSRLIKYLKQFDTQAQFKFFGGDMMAAQAGEQPIRHIRDMAFMGAVDILKNLSRIKDNIKTCEKEILAFAPDVVILIDYPGFNLKMARFAKEHGFKVFYYISPKIWAWNKKRAHKIKKYVDKLFVIFPFEKDFYRKYDYEVEYLGNPTVDEIHEYRQTPFNEEASYFYSHGLNPQKPVVAMLPGSRKQEIKFLLPVMVKVAKKFPDYQFVISGISLLPRELYDIAGDIPIIWDSSYDLLSISYAALVTSGTATLETALFKVPQVVMYKTAWLQYLIGRLIVRVRFFSLVNIILGYEAVKELLQYSIVRRATKELSRILSDYKYYRKIQDNYNKLEKILGPAGVAQRTAKRIVELLGNTAD